jgi:hypothetical protein
MDGETDALSEAELAGGLDLRGLEAARRSADCMRTGSSSR